jgi:hypothetical protein
MMQSESSREVGAMPYEASPPTRSRKIVRKKACWYFRLERSSWQAQYVPNAHACIAVLGE